MLNLLKVMWRPKQTISDLSEMKVTYLAVVFFAFQLILSLLLMNVFTTAIAKASAENPLIAASWKPMLVAFTILIASITNPIVIGFVATLLFLIIRVFKGEGRYRAVLGMLILAFVPAMIGRLINVIVFLLGLSKDVVQSAFSFAHIFPVPSNSTLTRILNMYDIFDLWTFILLILGFHWVSGLKRAPAYFSAFTVWAVLQIVFVRVQLAGVI